MATSSQQPGSSNAKAAVLYLTEHEASTTTTPHIDHEQVGPSTVEAAVPSFTEQAAASTSTSVIDHDIIILPPAPNP